MCYGPVCAYSYRHLRTEVVVRISLLQFLRHILLLKLELLDLPRLAGHLCLFLCECWGSEPRVLMLAWQTLFFTNWAIFPAQYTYICMYVCIFLYGNLDHTFILGSFIIIKDFLCDILSRDSCYLFYFFPFQPLCLLSLLLQCSG